MRSHFVQSLSDNLRPDHAESFDKLKIHAASCRESSTERNALAFAVHMALYAEISNGNQLMENLEKRLWHYSYQVTISFKSALPVQKAFAGAVSSAYPSAMPRRISFSSEILSIREISSL